MKVTMDPAKTTRLEAFSDKNEQILTFTLTLLPKFSSATVLRTNTVGLFNQFFRLTRV